MTLNLTDDEARVVAELAAQKEISKSAVMRQALRLYQSVSVRVSRGETMCFLDSKGNRTDIAILGMESGR